MTYEENELCNYLTSCQLSQGKKWKHWPRIYCCGTSRSLYCPDCCTILLPDEDIPQSIREGNLSLPIDIDLIFHDNRHHSSGIHAMCIFNWMNNHVMKNDHHVAMNLYDSLRGDCVPDYHNDQLSSSSHQLSNNTKYETCLLFPCEGESIPLSSVANDIKRLVVMDCKWKKTLKHLQHPIISKLPKVHLTNPPNQSQYWRWHNAGNGMVSTLEAMYYASCEIQNYRSYPNKESSSLLDLFFLFAIKRNIMAESALMNGELEPFSEAGKQQRRELRRTKGTEKHLRDKEIGRKMKDTEKHLRDKQIGRRLKELKQHVN